MDLGNITSSVLGMSKIQDLMKAIPFPAGKNQIIDKATSMGMDNKIVSMLQKLPDKQYQSSSDLENEIKSVK